MSAIRAEGYRAQTQLEVPETASQFQQQIARYHWAVALFLYTALAVALAYPALIALDSTIIGPSGGDNFWFAWLLWVFRRAVLAGQDPSHTHYVFALLPSVEVFMEGFFAEVVAFPLQSFLSPAGAYDLTIVLSFILSGFTMYLLAGEFVANRLARFAAGCLYDFSTFHFARAEGHLGLATMQWLPFCAWRIFVLYRRPTVANAILAGVGLALVPFSEIYFLPYFAVPFVGLFALYVLVSDRGWLTVRRNLGMTGLAVLVAAVVAGPYLATFILVDPDIHAVNTLAAQGGLEAYSADLLAFVLPNPANPLFGHLTIPIYAQMQGEEAAFLGYPALLLAATAFLFRRNRDRTALFWLVLGIVGVILALGPELHVDGRSILPLPAYKLVFGWSALSSFRAPNRLSIVPLLAVSMLAAYAVDAVMSSFGTGQRVRIVLACGLLVLLAESFVEGVYYQFTLTTSRVTVPLLYSQMAQDRTPGLALDVPFGVVAGERYQYFQTVHQRPLVFGAIPRPTDRMLSSVLDQPALAQFYQAGFPPSGRLQGQTGSIYPPPPLKQQLQEDHIRYVILHPLDIPPQDGWAQTYLRRELGTPFYRNDAEGLIAWRVEGRPPSGLYRLTTGSGWLAGSSVLNGKALRVVEQDGQLLIDAPRAGRRSLRFEADAYFRPLTMEIRLNGVSVKQIRFAPNVFQTVSLPALHLKRGVNILTIHAVEGCARASDFTAGLGDPRCYAFGIEQVRLGPA